MLAVPLRISDRSPFTGRAYVMTQIYVDYFFKLLGYIINVMKGKVGASPLQMKVFLVGRRSSRPTSPRCWRVNGSMAYAHGLRMGHKRYENPTLTTTTIIKQSLICVNAFVSRV